MDKKSIIVCIAFIVLMIFAFVQTHFVSNNNKNIKNEIEQIEINSKTIDNNNMKINTLIQDKIESSKKIAELENKLKKLKSKKPSKEGIDNEIKTYSPNTLSDTMCAMGYPNKVILRDRNICQLQYSSQNCK